MCRSSIGVGDGDATGKNASFLFRFSLQSLLLSVELVMMSDFEVDGVRHIPTFQHVCVSVSTGKWVRACDGGGRI